MRYGPVLTPPSVPTTLNPGPVESTSRSVLQSRERIDHRRISISARATRRRRGLRSRVSTKSRFQQLAQVQRPERAIRIVEPMYRRLSRCEIDRVAAVAVNPVKLRRSGNFNDRQRNSCQRRSWFWRRMGSGIGRGDAPCPTPHHAPPQVRPLRGRNHPSARPEGFVLSGRRPRSEAIPTASMGPGSASSQAPCRAQSRHPGP